VVEFVYDVNGDNPLGMGSGCSRSHVYLHDFSDSPSELVQQKRMLLTVVKAKV